MPYTNPYFSVTTEPNRSGRSGGGGTGFPLKLDQLWGFYLVLFFIRMHKTKAHIARESITTTLKGRSSVDFVRNLAAQASWLH